MVRPITRRVLALVLFAAPAAPVRASEVYQISTISSLLAGGYDGDTTVGELIRHGGFGLGTFNGVDGEMMVVDGEVFRGTIDGRAHVVAPSELTPFAVVVPLPPQGSVPIAAGQSLEHSWRRRSMPCPTAHRGCWRRGWRGGFAPSRFAASPSSSRLIAHWRMS